MQTGRDAASVAGVPICADALPSGWPRYFTYFLERRGLSRPAGVSGTQRAKTPTCHESKEQ